MFIAVVSFKGGAGKTTTAMHLAAFLQTDAPTVVFDADDIRNATTWAARGSMPFHVAPWAHQTKLASKYTHKVLDVGQRPKDVELIELAEGCDLLVIPAVPAALDTDSLVLSLQHLAKHGATNFRVLITKDPPAPETEGAALRAELEASKVPLFSVSIPRLKVFDKAASTGITVDAINGDQRAKRAWDAYATVGKEALAHG